jgi:hypothetical protein
MAPNTLGVRNGINFDDLMAAVFAVKQDAGNGSLEGFMNIGDKRAGLNRLDIKTHIKSSAPAEKLQELHDYVNEHSPIWDTISNPMQVTSQVVTGTMAAGA